MRMSQVQSHRHVFRIMRLVLWLPLSYWRKSWFKTFRLLVTEEMNNIALVMTYRIIVFWLSVQKIYFRRLIIVIFLLLLILNKRIVLILLSTFHPVYPPVLYLHISLHLFITHLICLSVWILVERFFILPAVETAWRFLLSLLVIEIQDLAPGTTLYRTYQLFKLWYFLVYLSCQGTVTLLLIRSFLLQQVDGRHYVQYLPKYFTILSTLFSLFSLLKSFLITIKTFLIFTWTNCFL